jgi:hypothetical protein
MIPLHRRFVRLEADHYDRDMLDLVSDGGLGWEQLLKHRRVVVLAEAGSGKTTEVREQVRLAVSAGRPAFAATVRAVGEKGLLGALTGNSPQQFASWKGEPQMRTSFSTPSMRRRLKTFV